MDKYFAIIKEKFKLSLKRKQKDKVESYIYKYLNHSKGLVVIDIGAHRGDFLKTLEKHFLIENAVLIEPIPDLALFLKSAFIRKEIHVFENAISDIDFSTINFKINVYGETSSILDIKWEMNELSDIDTRLEKMIKVTTRTLDSIVTELELDNVDLIKIDVQGVEHLVLSGGKEALSISNYVWIELSFKPLYFGSSIFQDIYNYMENIGFILLELSPGHRSPMNELLQVDALFKNSRLDN